MRTALLEINDELVDLPANLKGVFKFQNAFAAVQDLDTRTGEFSWALTLPRTRRNDAVFAQKGHPQALDKFAGAYTFRLRIEGQEWRGIWRPTSYKSGYVGALVMDGFSWALALGEKKLTDLQSLAPIPYDGTQLESILARDCDTTDVQFPLLSFGNFFGPPKLVEQADGSTKEVPLPASAVLDYPLSVDDYYPSVYYVNVVRAILREAGYFAQGPVLNEPDVRTWCITAAGANGSAWPWGALLPASASNGSQSQSAFSYYDAGPVAGGDRYTNNAVGFNEQPDGEIFFLPVPTPVVGLSPTRALNPTDANYIAPVAGTYTFAYSATISDGHQTLSGFFPPPRLGFDAVGLALIVSRGGEGFQDGDGGLCYAGALTPGQDRVVALHRVESSTPGLGTARGIYFNTASVFLDTGDSVNLCVFARRRLVDGDGNALLIRREFVVIFSATYFACTAYEDEQGVSVTALQPAALLPPLAQKEVLRDFLVRTNALLVTDAERGTATIDFRAGYTAAQGPPVDLTGRVDPEAYEPLPVLGTAGALLFSPADPGDDSLLAAITTAAQRAASVATPAVYSYPMPATAVIDPVDTVRIDLGSAAAIAGTVKAVQGAFAATATRSYQLAGGLRIGLPTAANDDALAKARSETAWDISGATPRVLRYLGPSSVGVTIPFQQRQVRFGLADYGGALAWAGENGAVALRYPASIEQARRGDRLRVPALLTPARYRQLSPGRRLWLGPVEYTVDSITNWDACDDAAACQLELLRVV